MDKREWSFSDTLCSGGSRPSDKGGGAFLSFRPWDKRGGDGGLKKDIFSAIRALVWSTGSTAAPPHNSFETTVQADFLNPRFFKIPDNSATESNFPSPVDKHCNFDFNILTVTDNEFEPICLTQGGSKIGFPPYTLRVPNSPCECLFKN